MITEFLAWTERHRGARTLETYQRYLSGVGNFAHFVGDRLTVEDLKPFHITRWVDKRHGDDADTTKAGAISAVKRVFNWAVEEGYLKESPVAKVHVPERASRREEAYLMPDQWNQLVATVSRNPKKKQAQAFLDAITVMKETGCRPQEMRKVEARHFDPAARVWEFPVKESKGKKVKRVVQLSDRAFEICERLASEHPGGPLFRNEDGKPWTNFALSNRCKRLEKKLGFQVFLYAIRHTFATQAIINGVDVVTIAALMGHKDLKMLMRIYQHVNKNQPHLRAKLQQAITVATSDAA